MTSSPTSPAVLCGSFARPSLFERSNSSCSTASSYSISLSPLTPSSPTVYGLPILESEPLASNFNSLKFSSPITTAQSDDGESSSPASPPEADDVTVKKTVRKYTCHCAKSFTTSGHLARHSRIHTGEKNYECRWEGCGARFSRQDNCMQHFRTHTLVNGNKRVVRKKRIESPVMLDDSLHPRFAGNRNRPIYSSLPAGNGLDALANVAASGYI